MEIIKRARGVSDGEIVAWNESQSNVQEEVNRRTAKAGYTDGDGQRMISRNNAAGKGDACRPVNKQRYDRNYERIFGHK